MRREVAQGERTGRRAGALGSLMGILLGALLVASAPASAQVADAALEVEAADETGVALPGVGVELKRPDKGLSKSSVTGVNGGARFGALQPGSYDVTVSLAGFETVEQKGVVLRVGQTGKVKVVLRASRTETVTVVAEAPLVDVYKTDSSTNIVPEQIQALPVANRNFEQLAFIAPGVQRERGEFRFVTGGPVVGSGGNASQSTILVDGVDYTDPALGLAKTRISQDAISEFRVINNRFDTEVGGSAGGALSIITRSGTNSLKGSVFGFYRADGLRAKGALEQESSADFYLGQFGLTLGGPIAKDRTHYFASLEHKTATSPVLFRPTGAYASQAADLQQPYRQTLVLLGVDHGLSESMRLSVKGDYERFRQENFRVGGVQDVSYGQQLNRDNWNFSLAHVWNLSSSGVNELRGQIGTRKYDEPTNSTAVSEWFSSGNTLKTGGNILGDLLGDGDQYELRDTFSAHLEGKTGTHDVKAGASWLHVKERLRIDTFQFGLFTYATDTRAIPIAYLYGVGSGDVTSSTNRIAAFVQDDWRPAGNLTVSLGVRYDVDTNGNNPDFTHPVYTGDRKVDSNNIQPRLGFSWDVAKNGAAVVRGGLGKFTGRYLLVPTLTELQQNGITGRVSYTRVNGAILGLPPAFWLDPTKPTTTGVALKPDISLLAQQLDAPESTQASVGVTLKLGQTGLYLDTEGIYVDGDKEIVIRDVNFRGNANPTRPNTSYNQINTYTNDGRSRYKALTFALNGTLKGGHLVTASVTLADKKNISDDFSPEFPTGYPNDPANIDAEWGRGRSNERFRLVVTGVFRLPLGFTAAPILEYGSGQPWTHRLGYDYNGDGKNSDRPAGVERFEEDGPPFRQVSLRLTKGFTLGNVGVDVIAEAFNLFNTTNYDVTSVDGAENFSGPTLANPAAATVKNPNYGRASSTLAPREIQLGLRVSF